MSHIWKRDLYCLDSQISFENFFNFAKLVVKQNIEFLYFVGFSKKVD